MRFLAAMVGLFAVLSGSQAPYSRPADARVAILIYHHINGESDDPEAGSISPSQFESHLRMLKEEGYHLLTLREFEAYMAGLLTPPDRSVLLTFDDGYMSVYDRAFPLLRKYQAPAVIFPVMKYYHTQGHGAWNLHLVYWQTQVMLESGLIDVGGHSYDGHGYVPTGEGGLEAGPFLTTRMWLEEAHRLETEAEYRDRIRHDLRQMLDVMAELGLSRLERNHFASPFGKFSPILMEELKSLGVEYVYTTDESAVNDRATDRYALYRLDAGSPRMTAGRLREALERQFAR